MSNGHVQPGEVISSNLINNILDRLEALEAGGGSGGSQTGPQITHFQPPVEQAVGRTLEVFGANFAIPASFNEVTVDGVRIVEFEPSQAGVLRFRVPFVAGTPRQVPLSIVNSQGSVEASYRVTPEVVVAGDPPQITTVTRADGSSTLRVGEPIVVQGHDFGATPGDNQLRISSRVVATEIYDITVDDVDTSSAVHVIEATLPADIVIHNDPLFDPMLLRLQVGEHDEVTLDIARVENP